jgi:serine protease AprX
MVSGAAALVVQQRPTITPDQVKRLLTNGAQKLKNADPVAQGKGMLDRSSSATSPPDRPQRRPAVRLLHRDRIAGGRTRHHPPQNQAGVTVTGEQDTFGGT